MIAARYFDGITARAIPVSVRRTANGIALYDDAEALVATHGYTDLRVIEDGMSHTPLSLRTASNPDCRLVFASAADARTVLDDLPREAWAKVRIGASAGSIAAWVCAAAVAGFIIVQAYPLLVPPITSLIPRSAEQQLGDQLIKGVVRQWPACTDTAGQQALDHMLARLLPDKAVPENAEPFKIHVVSSKVVNAFAFPGNHIVVFSSLIDKAESPDEVAGVVAHEIAHQLKRHPMQGLVRSIGATFLVSAVFGGVTPEAVTSWGAALYTFSFSRDAEREADAVALSLLNAAEIDVAGFSAFFRRLGAAEPGGPDKAEGVAKVFNYLSTHPPTADRVAEVDKAKAANKGALRPALTAEDWVSLRSMCRGEEPQEEETRI